MAKGRTVKQEHDEVMWKLLASMVKTQLQYLYDAEQKTAKLGVTDYQKGRKESLLTLLKDMANHLHEEGIIDARTFIATCTGFKSRKEREIERVCTH